ncbi:MAG: hypothetical protein RL757_722 [Bacteroidota bacterium]|jgi:hypothetical protein
MFLDCTKKLVKNPFLMAFILGGGLFSHAQTPVNPAEALSQSIKVEDLRQHLTVLTSDSLEGRETNTIGNFKAANYLASQIEKMGVPMLGIGKNAAGDAEMSYFQRMVYTNESWDDIQMSINDNRYQHQYQYYSFPGTNTNMPLLETDEVIFLGYGIDDERYSDYKGVDVKGKVIMIYQGEPMRGDTFSWVTRSQQLSSWSVDWRKKLATAYQKGVKCVLVVDGKIAQSIREGGKYFTRNTIGDIELADGRYANNLYIAPEIARAIIGNKTEKVIKTRRKRWERGKPHCIKLPCKVRIVQRKFMSQLVGNNVLAFIEGSDPQLKHEVVVVSAHYDHLGKKNENIYRGADDNGSGTSTVLEIAEALQTAKKNGVGPKRSVLCLWVTGEEKGLLGSNFYVKFPVFPLQNTIADVNIDMVGRVDEAHKDNPNYIYVIGADRLSADLDETVTRVNEKYSKLTLDYTYNDPKDPNSYYTRSDHYNFAVQNIPSVFFFNGTHEDYHRPSDTIDKINFEKMVKIARLAFHTVWELANQPKRPRLNAQPKQ